ncbi:MAG: hypothetical protein ACRDOM_01300 [Nocardioides sp.]
MTKIQIDIPDELLDRAREVLGGVTEADAVRIALAQVVRHHRQLEVIDWIAMHDPRREARDPEGKATTRR